MGAERFGRELAELTPAQQVEIVSDLSQRNRAFFELVRNHTFEGYYGSPRHGGNRDAVSWRMLGLPEPPPLGRAQYDLRKGSAS
jgi:gluconate 2-dehydrogenase gamma chain